MEAVGHNLRSSSEAIAHKTRMGFNLIEAAIVLAVVGGVIGAIWVAAAKFYEDYKVNKTVEDLQLIVRNTQGLISMQDSQTIGHAVNINSTLRAAGVFPKDWVDGNSIKNPFGGNTFIANFVNPERFDIYLFGGNKSTCAKLITRVSSLVNMGGAGYYNGSSMMLIGILKSGVGSIWSKTTLPVTITESESACAGFNVHSCFIIITFLYTRIN